MKNQFLRQGWIGVGLLGVLLSGSAWGDDARVSHARLPEVPTTYVLDEPHVLQEKTQRVLQQLLHEHDQATGEQVVVAVFQSLQGQDLVHWTNQIFQKWQLGQKEKDNGVLLALYWQDRQMRLEVGYGLESELTDAQSKMILLDYLKPLLRAGHPDEGLTSAALQVLSLLESPLVENGRALQILKGEGITEEQLDPSVYSSSGWLYFWVLVGVLIAVLILFSSVNRSASKQGMHHTLMIPPFLRRKSPWSESSQDRDDIFRGGGGTGGWGGGSSGGGGASEKW